MVAGWGRAVLQHWEQEQEKEVETNQGLGVRVEGTQYNIYPVSLFHHAGTAMWRAVTAAHRALSSLKLRAVHPTLCIRTLH